MKGLGALLAAPWTRAVYVRRVGAVVARYERLVTLAEADPGTPRGPLTVEVLTQHPGGLLEAERTPPELLTRRLVAARVEQANLRSGAALPAPAERDDRVRTLALADLTWLVRELRVLRRVARRRGVGEALLEAYRGLDRPDPLPAPTPELVTAAARVPGAEVRRRLVGLLELRYQRSDLAALLWPPAPDDASAEIRVGASREVPEGGAKRIEAYGRPVAIFRVDGALFALDDTCPHRGGALGRGEIQDGAVLCPLHAWPFDLESGAYRDNPRICVRTYAVEERDGQVFLQGPET